MCPSPRPAGADDVERIVRLVNRAYEVENFFVQGDRVSDVSVRGDIDTGTVFVFEDGATLQACIFTSLEGARGYFGMLAVDPAWQRQGLGRALIAHAERHLSALGASVVGITVVNLRQDLVTFYEGLGYRPVGTAPYVHRPVTQPVHFIVMEKVVGQRPSIEVPL